MTPDYWQRAKSVLDEALAQPTAERGKYLAAVCGANPTLRRDVESLIAFENSNGDALEVPALASVKNLSFQEERYVGRTFGSYIILKRRGAGGMGAVFFGGARRRRV